MYVCTSGREKEKGGEKSDQTNREYRFGGDSILASSKDYNIVLLYYYTIILLY